jgi:hypothetical protein
MTVVFSDVGIGSNGICRIAGACRESVIAGVTGVTREDGAVESASTQKAKCKMLKTRT